MANRENNTMAEFCNKFMRTIAEAKQMPDADMEFLQALEGDIIAYLKPPSPDQSQQQAPVGGALGGAMAQVMGGGGGGAPGPGAPNPDEFRRMISANAR